MPKNNTCTIVIKDVGDEGMVNVKLTFKRALNSKDCLTPSENLAFDALKFIKNLQEE